MRDDKFTTTSGIVNLHPTKGTHWVLQIKITLIHMDSYPQQTSRIKLKKVSFQNINFRKMIVIVQGIVCMCCISQI